ncbi:hypothetical protein KBB27_04290 [Patescibacteria group bacterium]|nr:hypothetical protein [Patescibacteria group bacterium]
MLAKRSLNGQLIAGMICGIAVLVLAYQRHGKTLWTIKETGYLVGGLVGILLWLWLDDPQYAIAISLIVVVFGAIPTLFSVWKSCRTESLSAWTCFLLSSVPILLTIPEWTFERVAQPIGWGIVNGGTLITILLGRRFAKSDSSS